MQTPMYALSVYIATMIAHVKIHMHLLIMSALNALNNNTIVQLQKNALIKVLIVISMTNILEYVFSVTLGIIMVQILLNVIQILIIALHTMICCVLNAKLDSASIQILPNVILILIIAFPKKEQFVLNVKLDSIQDPIHLFVIQMLINVIIMMIIIAQFAYLVITKVLISNNVLLMLIIVIIILTNIVTSVHQGMQLMVEFADFVILVLSQVTMAEHVNLVIPEVQPTEFPILVNNAKSINM